MPTPSALSAPALILLSMSLWVPAVAQAQTPTVAVGAEFQVNTYTTLDQAGPSVAVAPDGSFVVSWTSFGSTGTDTSFLSVQAQRYDSEGSKIGDEFQVNTSTTLTQGDSSVAVAADGRFVVVWTSFVSSGTDSSGYSLQGQRYASDGSTLGTEFQVNSYTMDNQLRPSVSTTPDGGFVVVWDSEGSSDTDTSGTSVQGQRYASDGSTLGDQFQVNTSTSFSQDYPSVSVAQDGDFVVVWESGGIKGQRYASDGSRLGDEFQVNAVTTAPVKYPSVAMTPDGGFVAAWQSLLSSTDGSGQAIQGQRFASDGTALGDEFLVNTYTNNDQDIPLVAVDASGDFMVAWRSDGSSGTDTSGLSVQGQRYASDGSAVGGQFQLNTFTTSDQEHASVATTPAGDFIAAWTSQGSTGTDPTTESIQARRFRVTADIGDTVFVDSDFDGRQDPSEMGAPGVGVHLRTDLGDLLASTVTDADGAFLFRPKIALDGVVDEFYVEFEAPLFGAFTAPEVGSDDTVDSDADPATGETATFEVASAGESHLDLDAGLISSVAVIGDRVWYDANRDGIQQVGETGLAGVTARLFDDEAVEVASATTSADGLFSFGNVDSGTYSIEVVVPADMEFTDQDVGLDDEIDSDIDPLTGRSATFVYTAGTISRGHDAGIRSIVLFEDGFESGNTSLWSSTTP